MIEVRKTAAFVDWLEALRDVRAKLRIVARLLRAEAGNPGDVKALGGAYRRCGSMSVPVTAFTSPNAARR
ncbi:MAG: hypothetical protein U1C54_16185 [Xanthomonadaceae bacterium]|nr:hypothetical protein [Xanthomonadaceae bacterium]MDZ4377775.1 hypothetical protein [Xanthomonadaceae bacterium]